MPTVFCRITNATWKNLVPAQFVCSDSRLIAARLLFPPLNRLCCGCIFRRGHLERTLRTRTSELEAADRHIAKLEEKILKLREATRELKQLKKDKHALRKCPERKVGQVILAPYRLPQRLFRELRKQFARSPGKPAPRENSTDEYQLWLARHRIAPDQIEGLREESRQFAYRPLISIVTPVFNPPVSGLQAAVESVLAQAYENWELILVDDASTNSETLEALPRFGRARFAHPVSAT